MKSPNDEYLPLVPEASTPASVLIFYSSSSSAEYACVELNLPVVQK